MYEGIRAVGPYQIARSNGSFFSTGGVFSAIWFLCRTDPESIFVLLFLTCIFVFIKPLVSRLPASLPLCSLVEATEVSLVMGKGKSQ